MGITKGPKFRHFRPCPHTLRRFHAFRRPLGVLPDRIADSSATNAVSLFIACTTNRFPSSRCASAIQIVRPSESIAETQPKLEPALLRLSVTVRSEILEQSITTTRERVFRLVLPQAVKDVGADSLGLGTLRQILKTNPAARTTAFLGAAWNVMVKAHERRLPSWTRIASICRPRA